MGEGQLTAAPNVRFDPEPSELTMPPGPVITNVRISPEVSEAMLKFVAPVLAGATQSEGLFSMQLDGRRVPLAEPKRADFGRQADRPLGPRRARPDGPAMGRLGATDRSARQAPRPDRARPTGNK